MSTHGPSRRSCPFAYGSFRSKQTQDIWAAPSPGGLALYLAAEQLLNPACKASRWRPPSAPGSRERSRFASPPCGLRSLTQMISAISDSRASSLCRCQTGATRSGTFLLSKFRRADHGRATEAAPAFASCRHVVAHALGGNGPFPDSCSAAIAFERVEGASSLRGTGSLRPRADRGRQKAAVVLSHFLGHELVEQGVHPQDEVLVLLRIEGQIV
jgi:hypothetical protein